ncbi:hypothetical protein GNY06_03975, partial [Elizabethkingia argentiflava]
MKPSLLSIFRRQKKLLYSLLFLITWSQLYGHSYQQYLLKSSQVDSYHSSFSLGSVSPSGLLGFLSGRVFSPSSVPVTRESVAPDKNERSFVPESPALSAYTSTEPPSPSGFAADVGSLPLRSYSSDLVEGIIGKDSHHPIDQVNDNIFTVEIDKQENFSGVAWLEYELYGVQDAGGISKSINDGLSYGGGSIKHAPTWSLQREVVDASLLKSGTNTILFTISPEAHYTYKIRHLQIKLGRSLPHGVVHTHTPRVVNTHYRSAESGVSHHLSFSDDIQLDIPSHSLKSSTVFSVTPLGVLDLAALPSELHNLSLGASGYRLLPHGDHFSIAARVSLTYDPGKIPEGYSEQDIRTFYFNRIEKKWIALERDSVDVSRHLIISRTTHFTDMINGIITLPESAETSAYAPTTLKDIKAGDPGSGIVQMPAPVANSQGTVSSSLPLKLPSGRQGLSPDLSISYNSEGGNGWLGLGWDLSVPSISIDTRWGVPIYDASKETEIYNFSGDQLSFRSGDRYTLPNKIEGFNTPRLSERQFWPRVEGSYNKILRHGDHPSNYWWEVITKGGTHHYFGGDGRSVVETAVLRQPVTGNIGHWSLYRSVDSHGNYIEYDYDTTSYGGSPGHGGQEHVLRSIHYTLHTSQSPSQSYRVQFITDSGRKDVQLNARLGFLQVFSKRLSKILLYYGETSIRSYDLNYKAGNFQKSLLSSVTENDSEGKAFYTHKLDYHDPLQGGKSLFRSVQKTRSSVPVDKASPLYNTVGKNNSFGMAFTVGIVPPEDALPTAKSGTIGPNSQYSTGQSLGQTLMLDLDGDGLADNVYLPGGKGRLNYLKNHFVPGGVVHFMGGQQNIENSSSFSHVKSMSNNFGVEATAGKVAFSGNINYLHSSEKNITLNYIEDVNNDGIPDLIDNGKVKFGYLENGILKYTEDSKLTRNPITTGPYHSTVDATEEKESREQSPLMDLVKVWKAPYTGEIRIQGRAALDSGSKDGITFMLQHGGAELQRNRISSGGVLPLSVGSRRVQKGDYLYFRISSVDNGVKDRLNLDAKIDYLSLSGGSIEPPYDENFKSYYSFDLKNDYLLSSKTGFSAPFASSLRLSGHFIKKATSGVVILRVEKKTAGSHIFKPLYTKQVGTPASSLSLNISDSSKEGDVYKVSLSSTSNIEWSDVDIDDLTAIFSGTLEGSSTTTTLYPLIDKRFYNWTKSSGIIPDKPHIGGGVTQLKPYLTFKNIDDKHPFRGDILVTIKKYTRQGVLLNAQDMRLDLNGYTQPVFDGEIQGKTLNLPAVSNDYYTFVGYMLEDSLQQEQIDHAKFKTSGGLFPANIFVSDSDALLEQDPSDSNKQITNKKDDGRFGPMYRNWGQFIYNGGWGNYSSSENPHWDSRPIDEGVLTIDTSDHSKSDPNTSTSVPVYRQRWFQLLAYRGVDPEHSDSSTLVSRYQGSKPNIYVDSNMLSTSRLGGDDISEMLGQGSNSGGGHFAPLKVSKSKIQSLGGGIGMEYSNYGLSSGEGHIKNLSNYIDLNGDGYPDVVQGSQIQYTHMLGGYGVHRGDMNIENSPVISDDRSKTKGFSAGNNASLPFKSDSQSQLSIRLSQAGYNMGAGLTTQSDYSDYDLIDINGDGLADRVFRDGKVSLNLGYSFSRSEHWNYGKDFRRGESTSVSMNAGLGGKVIKNASLSFGGNGSRTDSRQLEQMVDLNGDGLIDKIENGRIKINTGNGFIDYGSFSFVNSSSTEGKSLNFAVSVCPEIPLPPSPPKAFFKLCLNPSYNNGKSTSNTVAQIQDIDGDGLPDLLLGDGSKNIDYQLSNMGMSNLLKKVTLPMGGSWEVSYARTPNTYDHPQSKWVMSSVMTHDGFSGDSRFKPDYTKITIEYGKGYYSRRERSFYGFDQIKINHIDTRVGGSGSGSIYRYSLQRYNNTSYFLKGLLLSETLYDSQGKKWRSQENRFSLRPVSSTNEAVTLPEGDMEKNLINYAYFVAPTQTYSHFYEGGETPGKTTFTENISYDSYGNLKQYRDHGDMQIGSSELLTTYIDYQTINSGSRYMMHPTRIRTLGRDVQRERTATYDVQGNLTSLMLIGPGNPAYNFFYDVYGNMILSYEPQNAKGQRFTRNYTYDDQVHTYITQVKDAFGYISSTHYDYRFGVPLLTQDINRQSMHYSYDSRGRLQSITGPYELANRIPWTLHFDYHPVTHAPQNRTDSESYALTRHYDPEYQHQGGNSINTISISDGLGSIIQVKKTGSLYKDKSHMDAIQYIVSGKTEQDAFGRTLSTYYPTLEDLGGSNHRYNAAVDSAPPTQTRYDVLDRVVGLRQPGEDLLSHTAYGFGVDRLGRKMFRSTFTDELGREKKVYTDIKQRTTTLHEVSNSGDLLTNYTHNALGDVLEVRDVQGNLTQSVYDGLGRRISLRHPDTGVTRFSYDPAGNMSSRTTSEEERIDYDYEYNRLSQIRYGQSPENNVRYYYGGAGDASALSQNSIGRLWYQTDATGTQYYGYGRLGELTYNRRSVVVPSVGVYWFTTTWDYDTWNRIKKIRYPDGENLFYHYNKAGNLVRMNTNKGEDPNRGESIIRRLGYDKFDQRIYLRYGNNTETYYEYEHRRRRLLSVQADTPSPRSFMKNVYQYDVVSNITQIQNHAPYAREGLLGGGTNYAYGYDDLYRLTSASGNWRGMNSQGEQERHRYSVSMTYDQMHNVLSKEQLHEVGQGNSWITRTPSSYRLHYSGYSGLQPHAPKQIVDEPNVVGKLCCNGNDASVKFQQYRYDKKGNPVRIDQQTCYVTESKTRYIWDAENRLRLVNTQPSSRSAEGLALYTYDDGGERVVKNLMGPTTRIFLGGFRTKTLNDSRHMLYPSGMLSARLILNKSTGQYDLSYTKHYYSGSQRVSTKLGAGKDVGRWNCGWQVNPVSSSTIDERDTAQTILKRASSVNASLIRSQGIYLYPGYTDAQPMDSSCVKTYVGTPERDFYWYHSDHLGSSSYITGLDGEVNQNIEYFPSGEVFVENHKNAYNTPYKFNAKELDDETGYYYYGARYYNPRVSLWLNVDPLAEKMPSWSP